MLTCINVNRVNRVQAENGIPMHKWYPYAQMISLCTNGIPMHKWYPYAQMVSLCTNGIPMHKWYPYAQMVSLCTIGNVKCIEENGKSPKKHLPSGNILLAGTLLLNAVRRKKKGRDES